VELAEVNLKTFEAKKLPGLYLAGEVLNADGLTGGFNFQHAWTSGYLAGTSAAKSFQESKIPHESH
jgi:predicted flavoprotein YhiN